MKRLALIACLMIIFGAKAFAASTMLDYQKRVHRAAEQIKRIKTDQLYSEEGADYTKRLLPRSEPVEFRGKTITVDNSWLHTLLDRQASLADPKERAGILDEALGRLQALDEHLRAVEGDDSGQPQADDLRQKVREILTRAEFLEKSENPITAYIKKIRRQVLDFLQNLLERIFRALFGASAEASWLFRGIIIAAIALALFAAVRYGLRSKRGRKRAKKRTILGEEIEEGMTASQIARSAHEAAQAGDFRGAIRKLYVSLLYELAERNLLEIEPDATNHDYLARLSSFGGLLQPMRYLTDKFDYFWCGRVPTTEKDYSDYLVRYNESLERAEQLSPQPA
jgi:uncharacterized protein DUF4129